MPDTLAISAAARLCQCDRRTLQRAIHAGRLHLDAPHGLSREELIATGYLVPIHRLRTAPSIQFFPCFISHNHTDVTFTRRLHDRLQEQTSPRFPLHIWGSNRIWSHENNMTVPLPWTR